MTHWKRVWAVLTDIIKNSSTASAESSLRQVRVLSHQSEERRVSHPTVSLILLPRWTGARGIRRDYLKIKTHMQAWLFGHKFLHYSGFFLSATNSRYKQHAVTCFSSSPPHTIITSLKVSLLNRCENINFPPSSASISFHLPLCNSFPSSSSSSSTLFLFRNSCLGSFEAFACSYKAL